MRLRYWIIILLAITTLFAVGVFKYAASINSFFQNPIADRILLLVIILVDTVGILTPWIETRINDARERNKRLTEECIAKLQLDPFADDNHILTIPSANSHTDIFTHTYPSGDKPPYFQEMKNHLQNYPKLWKLIEELPISYRKTKQVYDSLVNELKKELETVATTQNLTFPYHAKDWVLFRLAEQVTDDLRGKTKDYRIEYDEIVHEASMAGITVKIPLSTAETLAEKMTELRRNTTYRDKCEAIMKDFNQVREKAREFPKERDVIVEEIRLSNYKNLKGKPWYKRLVC